MNDQRPIFAIAVPACRGRAIGDNAIRRAVALSDHYRPVIISDSFPDRVPEAVETIRIHPPRFHWLRRFCHVPNELGFAWAVRRALLSLRVRGDIAFLLCHGYTLAWFAGRWFRRRSGTPFGMFMHGHIFERPEGTYDPRVTAFYRAIAPTCYREADLLFALSPAQAELAVKAGAARERVQVSPNGLDLADVGLDRRSVEHKLADFEFHQPLRFLFVGRLNMEKGVDVMLSACAELRAKGTRFRLRIIGKGPEASNLRALRKKLELDDLVEFVGALPRVELGRYYLEHDVLLVPSLSEPLGNVVLEGMASGCLVVASKTGGIPSMVTDGETGFLVPPADPLALCRRLMTVPTDPKIVHRITDTAFRRVTEQYAWTVIGQKIWKAVSALARHQRGTG